MCRLNKFLSIVFFLIFVNKSFALQFGNGTDESTKKFIKVADNVKDINLDFYSSFYISNDNCLYGTGFSIYKRFNLEGPELQNSYVKLKDEVIYYRGNVLKFSNGKTYSTFDTFQEISSDFVKCSFGLWLKSDNTLWCLGENTHGAYGDGKKYSNYKDFHFLRDDVKDFFSNGYYTAILTVKNEVYISGEHYLPKPYKTTATFFKLADNVRYLADGFYITNNNELFVFGWCANGVSGLGNLGSQWQILPTKVMDNVLSVESNQQVTLIIKENGDLYGCGGDTKNYYGELGFGDKKPVFIPKFIMSDVKKVSLGICQTAVLKNDGTLWMCGANDFPGLM